MLENIKPQRDNRGTWIHPQLDALIGDREAASPDEFDAWKARHNINVRCVEMLEELDVDDPISQAYLDGGDAADWNPESPGPEWRLLSLVETEVGPIACWYRERP